MHRGDMKFWERGSRVFGTDGICSEGVMVMSYGHMTFRSGTGCVMSAGTCRRFWVQVSAWAWLLNNERRRAALAWSSLALGLAGRLGGGETRPFTGTDHLHTMGRRCFGT
jgi:hypothetical protein